IFFIYYDVHMLYLHSFPTRRSSDLILSSEKDLTHLSELSERNILGSESSANQSMLISGSSIISENILEEVKESKVNTDYPNLVYAELMTLITKHKINNTAGK